MYLVSWVDWLKGDTISMKVKTADVSKLVALILANAKPNTITITVTT